MDRCLLIGNGLNRCLKDGPAWGNLLQKTADRLGVEYEESISMPLEFERIINSYLSKAPDISMLQVLFDAVRNDYIEGLNAKSSGKNTRMISYLERKKTINSMGTVFAIIKADIAGQVAHIDLPKDALHRKIPALKPNAILTTNYDFLLEKAFDDKYTYNGHINGNTKYITHPTAQIDSAEFYHIHGIATHPVSICLGYEHYMDMVTVLRNSLNRNTGTGNWIQRVLAKEEKPENTWAERFFTSDIAILGLGLTECESDLWSLLTQRAYLYYTNRYGIRDIMKNNIVFYDVLNGVKKKKPEDEQYRIQDNLRKQKLHKLMEGEHIIVRQYTIGKDCGSYPEAYEKAIEDIKKDWF